MKIKNNKGLIRVLLSEQKDKGLLSLDFFENYFNEDCDKYLKYLKETGTISDLNELYDFARDMECRPSYVLRLMYEENPNNIVDKIIRQIRYDYIDGMIYLNKEDLIDMLVPDWLWTVVFDDYDNYDPFDMDDLELDEFLNDREKKIIEDEPKLKESAKNALMWAQVREWKDRILNTVMNAIKEHFKTDKIFFDEGSKGDLLIKFKGRRYIEDTVKKWFEFEEDKYLDEIFDCSSVTCLYSLMINNLEGFEKIEPEGIFMYENYDLKKVEEYFHELFKEEIG